jgi:hypothetical protein
MMECKRRYVSPHNPELECQKKRGNEVLNGMELNALHNVQFNPILNKSKQRDIILVCFVVKKNDFE